MLNFNEILAREKHIRNIIWNVLVYSWQFINRVKTKISNDPSQYFAWSEIFVKNFKEIHSRKKQNRFLASWQQLRRPCVYSRFPSHLTCVLKQTFYSESNTNTLTFDTKSPADKGRNFTAFYGQLGVGNVGVNVYKKIVEKNGQWRLDPEVGRTIKKSCKRNVGLVSWDGILGHQLKKSSSLLLHAIHSQFYWRI